MAILNDPSIHYRAFTPPVANENVYIVKHRDRAYLMYAHFTGDIVETHVAVPLRSRRRFMFEAGFDWFREKGAKIAVTAAPPERKALCGMLGSLGFKPCRQREDGDMIYMKVLI